MTTPISKGMRACAVAVSVLLSALAALILCRPHGLEPWLVYGFAVCACTAQAGLWALVHGLSRGAEKPATRGAAVLVVSSALIIVGAGVSFICGLCHIL